MTNSLPSMTPVQQRVIRVFVSSTFRDMHTERDELTKRIFPQLRKLCEERGVTWGEVDLRWGITEEESQRGEVLPICLAEIQRCRPYFIGLLGERYGCVTEKIPDELIDQEPWLAGRLHHSLTELEILHGVLNNPMMADHALFYFRDRAYIDSLPRDEQPDYLDLPTEEEIKRFRLQEAGHRAEERKHKLAALKERIRDHAEASGMPVRENYPNPQALGEKVLGDLTEIIDRLYPKGSEPDQLDRESMDHEAFAQSRAKVYIGRQSYYDHLDEHARGDGPPLVLLGESGSGKSALLANWALRYRGAHPEEMLLVHFIGATPFSADWTAMLRRVLGEFKRRFDIRQEIPGDPDELRAAFANSLHMAAARGKVVLILDALNQLEDRDAAPDLLWLPPEIPPNVRLIVSTLPGRPLDAVNKRGWSTLNVTLLQPRERLKLLWKYLRQYSKRLDKSRRRRIAIAEQSSNPLYLRALLDELRVLGIHEELDGRIDHYLAAPTPDKLYKKILERYEQDYERERPGLVRDAMAMLWAARRGLSETELLELLGANQQPLPRAHWSPLFLVAEQSLVSRSGLMGFGHHFLRKAVRSKYLRTKRQQEIAHRKLADYFEAQPPGRRRIEELPWQLAEAEEWQRLYNLLTEREFFGKAWKAAQSDVSAYWARIEEGSSLRLIDAYDSWLDQTDSIDNLQFLADVFMLLNSAGHVEKSHSFYLLWSEHIGEVTKSSGQQFPPGLRADAMLAKGRRDEALKLYKEQELICRKLGNNHTLQLVLADQAEILIGRGEFDQAMRLSEEQEQICRDLADGAQLPIVGKAGLQRSLLHQAIILRERREFDRAIRLTEEQERICRELEDMEFLQECIATRAGILRARGDLKAALRLCKEQEKICRALGYKKYLATCLGNQAEILRTLGKVEEASRLEEEQGGIGGALSDDAGNALVLDDSANDLYRHGQLDEAMELFRQGETLSRQAEDQRGLATSLGSEAMVAYSLGEFADALRMYKDGERIWRELGDKNGLQHNLGNQVALLNAMGSPTESLLACKEQESLCRELGDDTSLQQSLGNQAVLLLESGSFSEAQRLLEEQEDICRKLGFDQGLVYSLINQAVVAKEQGKPQQGLPLAEKAYELARKNSLVLVADQIRPFVDEVRAKAHKQSSHLYVSIPHPDARAERATQLNIKYQRELARWNSLPWLKRVTTKKPEPPTGI